MIPDYKKILYATDVTPNAALAFRHAVSLARHYEAEIHILHVLPEMEPAVVNYVATVMGEDRLVDLATERKDEIREEIRRQLEKFAREELSDHPDDLGRVAETEVVYGNPAVEILETAEQIDADLIVMGSHGKGRLRHVFVGSVAERVLAKSLRPVFVSRLVERREEPR
jgi:nucleotide-binding universal stress UspA family protein